MACELRSSASGWNEKKARGWANFPLVDVRSSSGTDGRGCWMMESEWRPSVPAGQRASAEKREAVIRALEKGDVICFPDAAQDMETRSKHAEILVDSLGPKAQLQLTKLRPRGFKHPLKMLGKESGSNTQSEVRHVVQ